MAQAKADVGKRIIAAIVDSLIAWVIGVILSFTIGLVIPFIGGLIAGLVTAGYLAFKDALPLEGLGGASPGKKVVGLKAVKEDGGNCDYETSLKRNWPFWLPAVVFALFNIIPVLGLLIGGPLVGILALILYGIEIYKVSSDDRGLRLGDSFAGTVVVAVDGAPGAAGITRLPPPPVRPTDEPPPAKSAEAKPPTPPPTPEGEAEEKGDEAPPPTPKG